MTKEKIVYCLVAVLIAGCALACTVKFLTTSHLQGAYITEPTRYTDLNVQNDLVVDGVTTLTGNTSITGAATVGTGLIVTAGDTNVLNFVQGGAVTGFTVSSTGVASVNTLSASNICDQSYIPVTVGNTTTAVLNFPTAAALYADCLTANGDTKSIYIYNTETVSSTSFLAGTSSTIHYASTTAGISDSTLYPARGIWVTFVRTALATMQILFTQMK
jgi:hypothetical protein